MDTSLSKHTLHVLSSCSLLSCSSSGKSKKRNQFLMKGNTSASPPMKSQENKNNVFSWFKLLVLFYLKHFLWEYTLYPVALREKKKKYYYGKQD